MDNKNLHSSSDEQIRKLMSDLDVSYDKGSWSSLEKKLDSIADIAQTDQLYKSVLSSYEAQYMPSSWAKLQYQMDLLQSNKRHLLSLKSIEIIVLFFFLWVFWVEGEDYKSKLVNGITSHTIINTTSKGSTEVPIDNTPVFNSKNDEAHHIVDRDLSSAYNDKSVQNEAISRSKKQNMAIAESFNSFGNQNDIYKVNKSEIRDKQSDISLNTIDKLLLPGSVKQAEPLPTTFPKFLHKEILGIEHIFEAQAEEIVDAMPVIAVKTKKPLQYWISGAISHDRDLIRTPYPSQQSVNHLGRIERNFHSEFNLFVSNGMVDFQTGIGIWFKEYQSVYEGINDAIVISIPANLRLKLSQRGFMRGYLMGGMSTHFVAYANYKETDYFKGLENTIIIENNYQARPSTIFSSSGYDNGIFEGESLRGNRFFTVNMGIGLDIPINKSFSMYLEQVYFHHIDGGIGPAFDKFSTSSSIIGLRYLLNHKASGSDLHF